MSLEPEIHIVGGVAEVWQGRSKTVEVPLADLLRQLAQSWDWTPSCGILPRYTRRWHQRNDLVGVAIEVPRHARTVRWLAENSREPYGPGAKYRELFLAFPYVILLIVFRRGSLTGYQQLYYRTAPLEEGEDLLLPNLLNVAKGYRQTAWVCLQHLSASALRAPSWPVKIDRIVDHVFTAAFNRSSEVHEGNSYWGLMRNIDPRLETLEAWQEASRKNRLFVLDVPWRPAKTTVSAELEWMLNQVGGGNPVRTATDLVGLISGARGRSARR